MEERIAWNVFTMTGRVEDYILYKNIGKEEEKERNDSKGEVPPEGERHD